MTRDLLLAADGSLYGIGAAIVIAIAGFAYTVYSGVRADRRNVMSSAGQAMNERINDLVRQVDEYKAEARECADARKQLEQENLRLMRELLKKNGG